MGARHTGEARDKVAILAYHKVNLSLYTAKQ